MKNQVHYLLLAAILLAFTACDNEDDEPLNPVSEQDKSFALNATYSNRAEISMGQLAISKANSFSVREFGELMVTEHTNAQDQLSSIAESLEVAIPDTLKDEQEVIQAQLNVLEDLEFDSAYIHSQINAHQEAQQVYQTQIDQGLNPQLIEYASITLPHINMHLTEALELKDGLFPDN